MIPRFWLTLLFVCFVHAQGTPLQNATETIGTTVAGSMVLYTIELEDALYQNIYINASMISGTSQTVLYIRYQNPPTSKTYDSKMGLDVDDDGDCAFAFTPYCPYPNQNNSGLYYIGLYAPVTGAEFRLIVSVLSNRVELNSLNILQGAPYQPGYVFWVNIPSGVASVNLTVVYSLNFIATVSASLAPEDKQDDCGEFDDDDLTLYVPDGVPGSIILNEFSDPPIQPGAWRLRFQSFICSDIYPYAFTLCETDSTDCPSLDFPDSEATTAGFSLLLVVGLMLFAL